MKWVSLGDVSCYTKHRVAELTKQRQHVTSIAGGRGRLTTIPIVRVRGGNSE